jgi:phosphopentomutase
MSRRAFVVVLDACGVGALPDAEDYGDEAANTLAHLADAEGGLELPTLEALGLGSILELAGVRSAPHPLLHGRLHPLGPGKDSTTGHWELMGVPIDSPPPSYPDGFPAELVDELRRATGRGVLCNAAFNGVEAIERFGERHLETGDLIVYTSQDSVLQIAAHVDVVAPAELYAACTSARAIMQGPHAVGRVIARPFQGPAGGFTRTEGRRDFALAPAGASYLSEIRDSGVPVHTVGKIAELFAYVGVDHDHSGPTNARAIEATTRLLRDLDTGMVFVNLIETDQVYGHRKDIPGFHAALRAIDAAVGVWLELLRPDDLFVLTADHGCDPTTPGTDHTREHAPLLASFEGHGGRRHDGPLADVGASALRWLANRDAALAGTAFVP